MKTMKLKDRTHTELEKLGSGRLNETFDDVVWKLVQHYKSCQMVRAN